MQTADPDCNAVSDHHSGLDDSDSDGPHKSMRKETVARLRVTRQRMVANHNKQSRVRSFKVRTVLASRLTELTGVIVTGGLSLVSSVMSIAAISIS